MKKILGIGLVLLVFSMKAIAAKMGDYIALWQNINQLKQIRTPQASDAVRNLETLLRAIDQTMSETITFMLAQAEMNHQQFTCLPKNFVLNQTTLINLMMSGFNNSTLAFSQKKEMPAAMFVIDELHRQYPCEPFK